MNVNNRSEKKIASKTLLLSVSWLQQHVCKKKKIGCVSVSDESGESNVDSVVEVGSASKSGMISDDL